MRIFGAACCRSSALRIEIDRSMCVSQNVSIGSTVLADESSAGTMQYESVSETTFDRRRNRRKFAPRSCASVLEPLPISIDGHCTVTCIDADADTAKRFTQTCQMLYSVANAYICRRSYLRGTGTGHRYCTVRVVQGPVLYVKRLVLRSVTAFKKKKN